MSSFGVVVYGQQVLMNNNLGSVFGDINWLWDRSVLIDIDGDGVNEVVVSAADLSTNGGNDRPNAKGLIALHFDGQTMVDVTASLLPSTAKTALLRNFVLADFNGDGRDDLFLNNTGTEGVSPFPGEQNRLLLSNNGRLVDATANLPEITDFSHGSVAADFDSDGDIDLFVNNLAEDDGVTSYLLLNAGNGQFSDPLYYYSNPAGPRADNFSPEFDGITPPYHAALIDYLDDGIPDIYLGAYVTYATGSPVYVGSGFIHNTGAAKFELAKDSVFADPVNGDVWSESSSEYTQSGDVDNDGDLDLIIYWPIRELGQGTYFQFLRNDGASGYKDASAQIAGQAGKGLFEFTAGRPSFQLVDADADGDLDLIQSLWSQDFSQQVSLTFENDGSGHFSRTPGSEFPATQQFTLGDVNGDWIPDAVYAVSDYALQAPDPIGVQYGAVRIGEISNAVARTGWQTDDKIAGGSAGDVLSGLAGNDFLNGNAGNDLIIGGAGNDYLEGREGLDTTKFNGNYSDYSVTLTKGHVDVADERSGAPDGTDVAVGIERLAFADGALALDLAGTAGQVYRVYQAAFARTPDEGGLKYWIDRADGGTTLSEIGGGFVSSVEFATIYGSNVSSTDFVGRLYQNILSRDGEAAGIAYWVGELDSGRRDMVSILVGFSESPENQALVAPSIDQGIWIPI